MKAVMYCIPGLGADRRLFNRLQIDAELHFLDWIPHQAEEDLTAYAARLAEQIQHDHVNLLGVSMGGMVATAIAQLRPVQKLYLLSTIKNFEERPPYYRLLDLLPLPPQRITGTIFQEFGSRFKPVYGNADQEAYQTFKEMLADTPVDFIHWAIEAIVNWKAHGLPKTPFLHLHGTDDALFPIQHIDQAVSIKKGTHFMVMNDAVLISQLINKDLKKEQQLSLIPH